MERLPVRPPVRLMSADRSPIRPASPRRRAAFGLGAFAIVTGLAACSDSSPTSTTTKKMSVAAAAYVDTALAFEDTVFYYHAKVNFPTQKAAVRDSGNRSGAQKLDAVLYDVVDYSIDPFLRNAGDQHSDFFRPDEAPGTVDNPTDARFQVSGLILPSSAGARPTAPVAYVWFPTYDGRNDSGRADSTQAVIRALDQQNPCGWVLDQRFNYGGQPTAMMAGLNPLLGDAPASSPQHGFAGWVDFENARYYLFVQNGVAGAYDPTAPAGMAVDTQVVARNPYTLQRPNSPVAILTGPATASAGEWITLGFRGGPVPSRTFGAATYGVTTVPYNRTMSDGGFLNITAGLMMDRTGMTYGGQLVPDVAVAGPSYSALSPSAPATAPDPVIKAAVTWLQSLTACGGTVTPVFASAPHLSRSVGLEAARPAGTKPGAGLRRISRHWTSALMRRLAPAGITRQR